MKTLIVTILVLLLSATGWLFLSTRDDPTIIRNGTVKAAHEKSNAVAHGTVEAVHPKRVSPSATLRAPPLSPSQALPILADIQQQAEAGDAASKVTFFNAVSWCLSERAARRDLEIAELRGAKVDPQQLSKAAEQLKACSTVSWEQSSKRFSHIREVAALGDVEAQLAMVRAVFSLPREDPSWILAHTDELQTMKRESVIFLAQAANGGSREAMERLSDIYRHGRFGQKDEALAAMYQRMATAIPIGPK